MLRSVGASFGSISTILEKPDQPVVLSTAASSTDTQWISLRRQIVFPRAENCDFRNINPITCLLIGFRDNFEPFLKSTEDSKQS